MKSGKERLDRSETPTPATAEPTALLPPLSYASLAHGKGYFLDISVKSFPYRSLLAVRTPLLDLVCVFGLIGGRKARRCSATIFFSFLHSLFCLRLPVLFVPASSGEIAGAGCPCGPPFAKPPAILSFVFFLSRGE